MRVGIVGGGPRGLWAVEELVQQAAAHHVAVDIEVWEPGQLGEGSAYARDQPEYWRINVPSHIIRTNSASFDEWRRSNGEAQPLDPFPPRCLVGEFLHEAWTTLLGTSLVGVTVTHVPRRVTHLEPSGDEAGRWRVEGRLYDEVLLATGHAPDWPGALRRGPGVVGTYPAEELAAIRPGTSVAIRGTALTFIDAVLELTEGRGGEFTSAGYQPSEREPAVIYARSRRGRFMVTKPAPDSPLGRLDLSEIVARGCAEIWAAPDLAAIERALAQTAAEMLATAREDGRAMPTDAVAISSVLAGTDATDDPVSELRTSRHIAAGEADPDARWAVGQAWRDLYPAIVGRTSFGGRDDLHGFGELAVRLERVGFGPPVANVDKLLALIDAGLIDVSQLGNHPAPRADVHMLVDAVLAPPGVIPGTLVADLVERGLGFQPAGARGIAVDRDGSLPGQRHLAVVGRDTEDVVLGPDTLNRELHDVIPRWAVRVIKEANEKLDRAMHATVPLTARLEPLLTELLADNARCAQLVEEFDSPVNILRPEPMLRNIDELVRAGADHGVTTRVFFARKANKALTFVDAVRDAGHSVDVASERELSQVLNRGLPGERIILSAAVKPDRLLELAVAQGVTISVDSVAELSRIEAIARSQSRTAQLAPRLAPDPTMLPPTRFGELLSVWLEALGGVSPSAAVAIVGVHLHLHGYAAADRQLALREAFELIDAAVAAGHQPTFIDLGGGVPMSYLDDAEQWQHFQEQLSAMNRGERESFTWKNDPLGSTYPFHQTPTRGAWLRELLAGETTPSGPNIATEFIRRGLSLHLEPGRSVLDGCGVILARVAFLKHRSDGVPLVGLAMNRTQCRTTSDDILLDPVLVRTAQDRGDGSNADSGTAWGPGAEGFLVGAYCIEDEVIVRRRMCFPQGITVGDVVAIPNTAGYFMHILESASHQIPLANNVVLSGALDQLAQLDDIDER